MLEEGDPFVPAGSEPPRRGAVPVRFFGTYEFSYIESQRALLPFLVDQQDERRGASADVVCTNRSYSYCRIWQICDKVVLHVLLLLGGPAWPTACLAVTGPGNM